METSEYLAEVQRLHEEARRRGLFFQNAQDAKLDGMWIDLDGHRLLSFSSCSYLGLERHPALITGVHDAVERYGTQFSSSRGYVSAPPYRELESTLDQIFGGFALVTPSTTMAHQIALPVLATEKDAVVMDHQVHHSVHLAANHVRANGGHVRVVKHGRLHDAVEVTGNLARNHGTVWFCFDGVYSMFGDLTPTDLVNEVLDTAPNIRLYVDDAHGMSWTGKYGCGSFLSRIPLTDRVVLATSFAKAFACGGGCLVFASREEAEKVRVCGGPMVFSGPMQPPMLGGALAAAKLHLTPDLIERQEVLSARVSQLNRLLASAEFPPLVVNQTPIFFLRAGLPRVAFRLAEAMREEGFYLNVSMFPAVPMRRAGLRLAVTANHSENDLDRLVDGLQTHYPRVLASEGLTKSELDELFGGALPEHNAPLPRKRHRAPVSNVNLHVEYHRSIKFLDAEEWDSILGEVGACNWEAMRLQEAVFSQQPRPEHNWDFHYVIVRGADSHPVLATYFTETLGKDDMLLRGSVSRAVEMRRRDDPYFLTSKVLHMGGGLSEGRHLYLDRTGPWREALDAMLCHMTEIFEASDSTVFLLRDLDDADSELDAELSDAGFLKLSTFSSHHLEIDWSSHEEFLAGLSKKSRRRLRPVFKDAPNWSSRVWGVYGEDAPEDLSLQLHKLYRNVATRKLKINTFDFPTDLIGAFLHSSAWEVVTVHLTVEAGGPKDSRPVAWYAAHRHGAAYVPFVPGLDYDYVYERGAYWHMLRIIVERARAIGAAEIHLGMDADYQKSRFGTKLRRNAAYVQAKDHFNTEVLREIIAELGLRESATLRRHTIGRPSIIVV